MKQNRLPIIAALIAAAIVSGCASTDTKEKRCETYASVYALYLATVSEGIRPVSKEESAAAAGAALFLRAYCGWTGVNTAKGQDTDANGVPVIIPPAK